MAHRAQSTSRVLALLLGSAIACAGFARADVAGSTRVGYVDMKRLLDNAPQVVAGRQKLEREFAARDRALRTDEARAGDLRARRDAAAAQSDTAALQREIDALERSIKRNRDGLRAELKTRSDQELDKSWREISDAVVEFAREQNFDLIVPSPVIYASPKVDVTEQILDRLRRQAAKAGTP